jgi:hypothetical protein
MEVHAQDWLTLALSAFFCVVGILFFLDGRGERKANADAIKVVDRRVDLVRTDHTALDGRVLALAGRVNTIGACVDRHDGTIARLRDAFPEDARLTAPALPGRARRAPAAPQPAAPAPRMRADIRPSAYPSIRHVSFATVDGVHVALDVDARDVNDREGTVRVDVRRFDDDGAFVAVRIAHVQTEARAVARALVLDALPPDAPPPDAPPPVDMEGDRAGVNPGDAIPGDPKAPTEAEQIERSLKALRELFADHPLDPGARAVAARWEAMLRDAQERAARRAPIRPAPPNVARALGARGTMLGLGVAAEGHDSPDTRDDTPDAEAARDAAQGATGEAGAADASGADDDEATHVWTVEPGAADAQIPGVPVRAKERTSTLVSEVAPPPSEPRGRSLEDIAGLDAEARARIDALAEAWGITREEMLDRVIEAGLRNALGLPLPSPPPLPGKPESDDAPPSPPSGDRKR